MKSVLSAGLVAALLCPTAVIAGSTCPKTARGSHRVTCFSEIDYTEVHEEGHGHHKRSHKKKLETTRTISLYSWSFFWNWVAKDDCPKTTAHLSTILPLLANTHHGIRCTVEVGWNPEHGAPEKSHDSASGSSHKGAIEEPHGASGNQSHGQWEYAGHGHIDWLSLPAKMEWPLHASFERPDQFAGSEELGAKYEVANHGDMNKLEIHSGHGNDFAHSWSHDDHLKLGEHGGHGEHQDEGHNEFGDIGKIGELGKIGKRAHKDKEVPRASVGKDHRKFGGHYNTKTLHSCWVFEKYHVSSRQVIPEKKKHHGHHKGHNDEIVAAPVIPFHQPEWSICEPQIPLPVPCEEECHGDSCGSKHDDCKGDSCDLKQNDCHHDSCNEKGKVVDDCNTSSCDDKKKEENSCHDGVCTLKQTRPSNCHGSFCEHVANGHEACKPQSCHEDHCGDESCDGSDSDNDSGSDDDCERDCGDNGNSDDGSDRGSDSDGGSECEKACRSKGEH